MAREWSTVFTYAGPGEGSEVPGEPAAFMSYAHFNDAHDDGQLSTLRARLAAEVRAQTGREFVIFQDRSDIVWGQNWRKRIDETLDVVTLLLVIITPGFFASKECQAEVARFREREQELGRADLILPVYYIWTRQMHDPVARESDELARLLASRQLADWRELRFKPFTSPVVRKAVAQLASRMRDSFWEPAPAPDQPVDVRERQAETATVPVKPADPIGQVGAKAEEPVPVVDADPTGPSLPTARPLPSTPSVGRTENTVATPAEKAPEPVHSTQTPTVQLLATAECIARSITGEDDKARALSEIAVVMAATNPDDAERIAQSITDDGHKARAMNGIAEALSATDPRHAAWLRATAERIAQSITSDNDRVKPWALSEIAVVMAATDPDHAERIAQSITDKGHKAKAMISVAVALTATHPRRAERIARSIAGITKAHYQWRVITVGVAIIAGKAVDTKPLGLFTDDADRVRALSIIGKTLADTDPRRAARLLAAAERIAQSITDKGHEAKAMIGVAATVGATDPGRAAQLLAYVERIAQSITNPEDRATALSSLAATVAATDPDRAARLLAEAERIITWMVIGEVNKAKAKIGVAAAALAATDPDRATRLLAEAERIAQSITSEHLNRERQSAWRDIAEVVAAINPDRAERIAESITDPNVKVQLLLKIVSIQTASRFSA
jgi:hypothetical protein